MNTEDIIRMAQEAGFDIENLMLEPTICVDGISVTYKIKHLADLILKSERKDCAAWFDLNDTLMFWGNQVADAIRARGTDAA